MSSTQQSSSYSTTTYSTSTSTSTSSTNGTSTTKSYTQTFNSNDQGTTYETVRSETGRPTLIETTSIPAGFGSGPGSGSGSGSVGAGTVQNQQQGRIEDVSDDLQRERDAEYLERMEDEYAKREGGA